MHVVLPSELRALLARSEEGVDDKAHIFDTVADTLGHVPFTNEMQCAIATGENSGKSASRETYYELLIALFFEMSN